MNYSTTKTGNQKEISQTYEGQTELHCLQSNAIRTWIMKYLIQVEKLGGKLIIEELKEKDASWKSCMCS